MLSTPPVRVLTRSLPSADEVAAIAIALGHHQQALAGQSQLPTTSRWALAGRRAAMRAPSQVAVRGWNAQR